MKKHDTIKRKLFTMFLFGCIGTTTEIIFTALKKVATDVDHHQSIDVSLTGKTYVWMIFIYSLIPVLGDFIYPKIKHWVSIYRVLLYVTLTFLVEFISGGILKLILGKCPWEYTEGVHILGIIRIDYFIFLEFFMYFIEYIYLKLTKIHF